MGSITITGENGKKYILAYNRSAVVKMEQQGFNVEKIKTEPLSTIILLIRGAFYMHNESLSNEEIDAIAEQIGNSDGLIKELLNLYSACIMSLSGQDKKETKNFKWEKN